MGIRKVTRVTLDDQEHDYYMLGLVSAEPDYKVSLDLNRKLNISLRNSTPLTVRSGDTEVAFSRFTAPGNSFAWTLISNRQGKYFLLEKLKNVDYLLQVYFTGKENSRDVITCLRELESLTGIFKIDLANLRDKNLRYITQ